MFEDPLVYYLGGSLVMFVLGIAAGNYATSLVHRLPRGLVIANDPPYCECERRVYLETRDLFPLFSWIINKGKCRFCDIKIPATYTVIEGLCGFLFVMNYLIYGLGEELVLVLAMQVFLITIASIHFLENRLMVILLVTLGGLGGIYRTLLDGTTLNFIMGGYLAMMLGIVLWGLEMLLRRKKISFPHYAVMLGIGGLCMGRDMLLTYFIVAFVIALLSSCLSCVSSRFSQSAWIIGITGSVILALSHG